MWSYGLPMNSPDPEASKLVSHLMPYVQQGVSDFFLSFSFLFFFFFIFHNKQKTIMKNTNSKSLHQKLCNSPKIWMIFFQFLVAKFFCFTFEKKDVLSFFLVNQKKMVTKKLKLPFESMDNFASCHVTVFKLRKVSLFFY